MNIKEISVYTFGDSRLVKTWSNVPYCLTKTLEKKGYIVNRIDISPNRYLQAIYNRLIYPITRLIKKDNVYLYERTLLNYALTFSKIFFCNFKYKHTDLNIFTNFSFYNKFSSAPNLLFCDWDLDIGINDRLKRKPYFFEQLAIDRQTSVIERADIVISLFPNSAELMKRKYTNKNIFHLNQNVINSLYEERVHAEEVIIQKQTSHSLLFIGSKNYIAGAKLIIDAYGKLKEIYPNLTINIVGISKDEFEGDLPNDIILHGYLDKSISEQRELYYDLILHAGIFVNPTPIWGGYSSTIETMFFYTPIIIAPYEEFVAEFGKDIGFGKYCDEFSPNYFITCVRQIFDSSDYKKKCISAHEAVSDYTWDNYVELMMSKLKL